AFGVDDGARVLGDVADDDDTAVAHTHVGAAARCAGAVDDVGSADDQVEHRVPLRERWCQGSVAPMTRIAVTGSAGGIGGASRARIEAAGHDVLGVDVRDAEVVADLSSPDGRAAACREITAETG